jgi:hypothetical protein
MGLHGVVRETSTDPGVCSSRKVTGRSAAHFSGPSRRSPRLTVEADRLSCAAIDRTLVPARCRSAICRRSSRNRYRPEGSGLFRGICPPVAWRQRRPVRRSTPTASHAAINVQPWAINTQNWAFLVDPFLLRQHAQHLTIKGVLQRPIELANPLRDAQTAAAICVVVVRYLPVSHGRE